MVNDVFDRIGGLIGSHRYYYSREAGLQEAIALMLEAEGFTVERELRLDSRNRVDLVVCRVGVETKLAGSRAELLRQAARYLASDRLDSLIVVSSRSRHLLLPLKIDGKRLGRVSLTWAGL